jgi:hypothetical protein
MADATPMQIHQEHQQLHLEHLPWLADIAAWQEEQQGAIETLNRAKEILRDHGVLIDAHEGETRRIDGLGRSTNGHDHQSETRHHDRQRHLHEQLKRRHHELMAHIASLSEILDHYDEA